jgi:REP element-mobilizing transposase RayT
MDEYLSLNHTKWECKYHVVFMSCSSRSAADEHCTCNRGSIWARCSANWHRRREAESKRDI